jgi:PhoD-like phosphatase/Alpha/beta hydrolase of unknown function (DUF900)
MKIVFTSCMDAERRPRQPIWAEIASKNPDLVMLLGDQIYMDWGDLSESNWKRRIRKQGKPALNDYAQEMHDRYKAQWEVKEFRKFITEFVAAKGPQNLILTWDDHDCAWNNCVGAAPIAGIPDEHGVPNEVKAISYALFQQFVGVLKSPGGNNSYPGLPNSFAPVLNGAPGLEAFGKLPAPANPQVDFALLDTRWHRTERLGRDLLGPAQRQKLLALAQKPEGLLIVAGGTPMHYQFAISNQGWYSEDEKLKYRDYDEFLSDAKRPVLYLSGDVHKNDWAGRLFSSDGKPSSVLQILASGAALDGAGWYYIGPSFVSLEIGFNNGANAFSGVVQSIFHRQEKNGPWQSTSLPSLGFNQTDWQGALLGSSATDIDAPPDRQPISVLAALKRRQGYEQHAVLPAVKKLSGMDIVFAEEALKPRHSPEPLLISQASAGGEISVSFQGDFSLGAEWAERTKALIFAAFERARASGKKSVMLFVHGVGHPIGSATAQGYRFRKTYPDCEPIVFAWPAARADGWQDLQASVERLKAAAIDSAKALQEVLQAFAQVSRDQRFSGLTKIVLARSAGTAAMHYALNELSRAVDKDLDPALKGIDRFVLASALLKTSDFQRDSNAGSFGNTTIPKFVLFNRNDKTLNRGDWLDGFGKMLGMDEPPNSMQAHEIFLDYTDSPLVFALHDYISIPLNPAQSRINTALVYDKILNPATFQGLSNVRLNYYKVT